MRIVAATLDDLCRKALPKLLNGADATLPSRDSAQERRGVLLELRNPRARLSRTETRGKLYSSLGELLWYLSGDNRLDFIEHYIPRYVEESEDEETIRSGYGRRLFAHQSHNQVRSLIEALAPGPDSRPNTRRAVLQIFEAEDTAKHHKEAPCTLALQFLLRNGRLHMMVTMRSNDAYLGLPHDVFCFTMLQEIIARSIEAEIGEYKQFVGSLHLYDRNRQEAEQFLAEGVQSTIPMQSMPLGDPWPAIRLLLETEDRIRTGMRPKNSVFKLNAYWVDIVRLLQIFAATGDAARIQRLKSKLTFKGYHAYVDGRKGMKRRSPHQPRQPRLPF